MKQRHYTNTGEIYYVCSECSALVESFTLHDEWHEKMLNKIARAAFPDVIG